MKDKLIQFWGEYTKSVNWTITAIWFVVLNLLFWDRWNLSKFFLLVGLFMFLTLYTWFRWKYLPEVKEKKKE